MGVHVVAVILPNVMLAVARKTHPMARDEHGQPVASPSPSTPTTGYLPGGVKENPDAGAEQGLDWSLRLDPSFWPVKQDDTVHEEGGQARVWVLVGRPSLKTIVGYDAVDYIASTGVLQVPEVP